MSGQLLALGGVLLTSFLVSVSLLPALIRYANRKGILDHPHERKLHKEPVPYLGGVAIYLGFVCGLCLVHYSVEWIGSKKFYLLLITSSLITLLGLYDDIKGSNAKIKLTVQTAVAILMVGSGIYIQQITNPFGGEPIQLFWLGPVITVLWIVFITNSFNLLDGLDGLASGVSMITIIFMLFFAFLSMDFHILGILASLLGAIVGFFLFNFPPARIYMGDTGSLLIGFLVSTLCIMPSSKGPYNIAVLIPAILTAVPIIDTILAIFRRAKGGFKIFSADKRHLHHRILNLNNSYRKTLFIIYGVNFYICLHAVLAYFLPNKFRIILFFILAQDILFGVYILRLIERIKFKGSAK